MSGKLLNPKVNFCYRRWLTEDKMLSLLKKIKSKKFGAKIFAVDVEEVDLGHTLHSAFGIKKPGKYFHIRIEYIL